jgi:putative photosynthetic complex assembly protein 2
MSHAVPALFVLFVWWASTAAVLFVDGLPRRTFRTSVGVSTLLTLVALYGVAWSRDVERPLGAYVAFSSSLMVWAWHELAFLLGWVTGPRKEPCPPDARGWDRFRFATAAVIHHEVALFVTLLGLVALTWRAPNQVATWTFGVLWVMRLSAKLNVFLGVRNLSEDFIPEHLQYLRSYFRRAKLNPLMPLSILGASAALVWMVELARTQGPHGAAGVGTTLVATMLGLAVLEHVFLAVPVPDAVLWKWALRRPEKDV